MITRSVKVQLMVFLIISVIGLSYTAVRYAGLGRFFVDTGYLVAADFVDSGGIFTGAEVTYRGVTSGTVEDLELIEDGVRVHMRLRPGTQVPADTTAKVGNRSAVGEQFVDLAPQSSGEPFLDAGAVIPRDRTSIPIAPETFVVNLDDFVRSIDVRDVGIVLDELGQAFDGAGDSLTRLVDSGDLLTQAAIDALPETVQLIRDGRVALDTQRDVSQQFLSFNRDLALLSATLRSSDPDFRRLFDTGTRSAREVTALLENNRTDLPVLLENLVTVAQIQKVRIPAIRQTLITYPNVVAGGYTVVPGDGTTHFGLVVESEPLVCKRGYETTDERRPEDTSVRTPNLLAYCAEEEGSPTNVRGARRAPYPAGSAPFPEGRPDQTGATATSGSRTPDLDEPDDLVVADYDPITGSVIAEDGRRMSIGSTSGAGRVFGADSWQWLLLGPLSR